MKEQPLNLIKIDTDWGFNTPREEMIEFSDVLAEANKIEKELSKMTNEEFAQYCFELRLALYEEELRRFGGVDREN